MPQNCFEIRTSRDGFSESFRVFAETAGKARYDVVLNARDAGFEGVTFADVKVRKLGMIETSAEHHARQIADFNARYPVGTPVRVYPGRMGDHDIAYDTVVKEPGAFLLGGGVSVKVSGDSIALTHVVPLVSK